MNWQTHGWALGSSILLLDRSSLGIPSDQSKGPRHLQNSVSPSLWSLWVFGHALWTCQCSNQLGCPLVMSFLYRDEVAWLDFACMQPYFRMSHARRIKVRMHVDNHYGGLFLYTSDLITLKWCYFILPILLFLSQFPFLSIPTRTYGN